MQLNQDYVMPWANEIIQKKKKDPETIEELDRQLWYMERSIATIKVNTIKNETRTKNDIKKRTKENQQLIWDLNDLRNWEKHLNQRIISLQQEIVEMKFKMDKQNRLMEIDIKQKASKSMAPMRESEESIPNLLHRPQSGLQAGKQGRFIPKGKIIKGTPFA